MNMHAPQLGMRKLDYLVLTPRRHNQDIPDMQRQFPTVIDPIPAGTFRDDVQLMLLMWEMLRKGGAQAPCGKKDRIHTR